MNFYKIIKQQYEQYEKKVHAMPSTCDDCPCEMLRDKIFGSCGNRDCTSEMMYLVKKYNISGTNIFSCYGCMLASVKIAKKLFVKEFNKI